MALNLEDLSLHDHTESFEADLTDLSLGEKEDVEMQDVFHSTPSAKPFRPFQPAKSSPLRMQVDPEDEDFEMEDAETSNSFLNISLVFSPTALGAQLATQSGQRLSRNLTEKLYEAKDESTDNDTESDASSVMVVRNRNKPKAPSRLSQHVTNTEDESGEETTTTIDTQDSPSKYQTPWNQPVFQMHHHHYYPANSSMDNSQASQSVVLPAPWSKFAEPKAPTPYLISSYLQLLFNAFTSSLVIYILISAIRTVRTDINHRMEEYATEIALDVQRCTRSYLENRCAPATRAAALEQICAEWERCMARDPRVAANKASVSAETLGLIVNSLIEPIGVKAIAVVALVVVAWTFTSNLIFGFVRAKSYYGWDGEKAVQYESGHQGYENRQILGDLSPVKPHNG